MSALKFLLTAYQRFQSLHTVILFLFAGGLAAFSQIVVYVFLSRILEIHYLTASSIAFLTALLISFFLQKFVAFQNRDSRETPRQFLWFVSLAFINLHMNGLLMYSLVEYGGINDILSQMICMGTIAVWSFFAYRHFIFR